MPRFRRWWVALLLVPFLLPLPVLGQGAAVNSVQFSPDGTQLVTAGSDRTLRIWDAATGQLLHTRQADPSIAFFVTASPDGQTLATVGQDTGIRLWDAATGQRLRVIG